MDTLPNKLVYFDKVRKTNEESLVIFFKIVHAIPFEHVVLKPCSGSASSIILLSFFMYYDGVSLMVSSCEDDN